MTSLRSTLPRTLRWPSLVLRPGVAPLLSSAARRNFSELNPTPIFHLTETEEMLKESVGRFAREVVLPKVREMDEAEKMDKGIVEQLFEQGLMGVEVEEEYGGSGMGFGAAVVAIEELARVDPSVSSFCVFGDLPLENGMNLWEEREEEGGAIKGDKRLGFQNTYLQEPSH